jgi:hypothetical protein
MQCYFTLILAASVIRHHSTCLDAICALRRYATIYVVFVLLNAFERNPACGGIRASAGNVWVVRFNHYSSETWVCAWCNAH